MYYPKDVLNTASVYRSVRHCPSPSVFAFVALFPYNLKQISCSLFSKPKANFTCMENGCHGKSQKNSCKTYKQLVQE